MADPRETAAVIGQELTIAPSLNEKLTAIAENFRLKHFQEIRVSDPILTAGNLTWQLLTFGYPGRKSHDEKFRGYLMIEPQDFPTVLALLDDTAQRRLDGNKSTEFKWLMMKCPPHTTDIKRFMSNPSNMGEYAYLLPSDPRIVLYGNENTDIFDIYSDLIADSRWQGIEANRRTAYEMHGISSPIRGSNIFVDSANREWRSLCFNALPGTTESHARVAEDK